MRYLLIPEADIAEQVDARFKPRVPDGRIIFTESEAKALDNFSAQFISAKALKELIAAGKPETATEENTATEADPVTEETPATEEPVTEADPATEEPVTEDSPNP